MVKLGVGINICGEIHRFQAVPGPRSRDQGVGVDFTVRRVLNCTFLHTFLAYQASQRARIDAGQADNALFCEPGVKMVVCAPVGGRRDGLAKHGADSRAGRIGARFLMIFGVRADISDMREGKQHNLFRIRGVCEDFLIARHRCVETQFSDRHSCSARADSEEDRTIR